MWHESEREEMRTKCWSGNPKGIDDSEDTGTDVRIILEWILGKYNGKVSTGFIWLGVRTSGGLM